MLSKNVLDECLIVITFYYYKLAAKIAFKQNNSGWTIKRKL